MFNKSLITILLVIIAVFCIALYALLMQVFGIDNTNKATIISGVLGLLGGIIGAFGAYFASSNQIKKQFENQDRNRVLEINIDKSNQALNLLYAFKSYIDNFRGNMYNLEIPTTKIIEKCMSQDSIFINRSLLIDDNFYDEMGKNIDKMISYKDQLRQLKIFVEKHIDYEELENALFSFINAYKGLLNLDWKYDEFISIEKCDIESDWFHIRCKFDDTYEKLIEKQELNINNLEENITELLRIN